jgi:hypothetical protein
VSNLPYDTAIIDEEDEVEALADHDEHCVHLLDLRFSDLRVISTLRQ